MTPRDWPTRLKGCRTSVTGTLRDVLTYASGRTAERRAAHGAHGSARGALHGFDSRRLVPAPVSTLASSPVPAPDATPPRREHFLGLDCE